jgi:purine-binding chemotaxis protein CheW
VKGGHLDWEAVRGRLADAERRLAATLAYDEARTEALWRRRAQTLAARPTTAAPIEPATVMTFLLGRERYALPVGALGQVVPAAGVVPVPGAPPAVLGVANLRGEVGTVWDLARLLGLPAGEGGHILVLARNPQIGLRADHVEGTEEIDLGALAAAAAPPVRGSTPALLHVLDPEALLASIEAEDQE